MTLLDDAVAAAVAELQGDPKMARFNTAADVGGCLVASRLFAQALDRRHIPYQIRRYRALPGWRTQQQHVVVVFDCVVDWTAVQFRPGPDWPDIRPVTVFEAEFGPPTPCCPRCGQQDPHQCVGPNDEKINQKTAAQIAAMPRSQRRQLERALKRQARRAGIR